MIRAWNVFGENYGALRTEPASGLDLANAISGPIARDRMRPYRKMAIRPDAIGRAIRSAIEQPEV